MTDSRSRGLASTSPLLCLRLTVPSGRLSANRVAFAPRIPRSSRVIHEKRKQSREKGSREDRKQACQTDTTLLVSLGKVGKRSKTTRCHSLFSQNSQRRRLNRLEGTTVHFFFFSLSFSLLSLSLSLFSFLSFCFPLFSFFFSMSLRETLCEGKSSWFPAGIKRRVERQAKKVWLSTSHQLRGSNHPLSNYGTRETRIYERPRENHHHSARTLGFSLTAASDSFRGFRGLAIFIHLCLRRRSGLVRPSFFSV